MFKNSLKIKNLQSEGLRIKFKIRRLGKKSLIGLITLVLVILPTAILILMNAKGVEAAWANEDWSYRKSIAITAHTSSENNVYISTTLSNTNTLVTNGQLQSDCGDLRFTKQNGEVLPYYISSGCNSASTVVHINFDTFPAGAQTIYFYYGNPSIYDGFRAIDFSTEATGYTIGSTGSEEKAPSPVAYWKFDDATGTTAQDSTTNNNDGTLTNGPTWQTEDMCVSGKCLKFDGTDDYVSVSDTNVLDYSTGSMTLASWVRRIPGGTNTPIFSKRVNGSSDTNYSLFFNNNGTLGTWNGSNFLTTTGTVSLNTWHYIVAVYSTTSITYYVDGNLFETINQTSTTANAGPLYIGTAYPNAEPFSGFIDEPKIYNYARSSAQILADYNSRANAEGLSADIGNSDQWKSLSNGLVGYWKMDQSSWNGTASEVVDSSGNSNNGTSVNSATTTTGKFGNSGSFNGSTHYVTVADNTSLKPSTEITISAWLKNGGSNNKAISKGGWMYFLGLGSGVHAFGVRTTNGAFHSLNGVTAATSEWTHVVGVYDGTKMYLYINGVLDNSTAVSGNIHAGSSDILNIGNNGGTVQYFNGSIDEARIYNRSLSPAEVSTLYNFAPGPVASYNFDENTGSAVNDRSGNANTGTWNGSGSPHWKPGKNGSAGNFDGSSDYVDMGDVLDTNSSNFTLEAWIKTSSTANYNTIIRKGNGGANDYLLRLQQTTGYALIYYVDSSINVVSVTGTRNLADGVWHHVVGVLDRSGNVTLYVDGVIDGTPASATSLGSISNTASLNIGRKSDQTTANEYFNGQIDDLKIYNYARTQQQIIEDMTNGSDVGGSGYASANSSTGGSIAKPVGYWKFDEGYSTTANNVGNGGTALNGTLTGMASTATSGWTQSGKVGKALVFDGTNDYVNISALAAINRYTVSVWVNPTSSLTNGETQIFSAASDSMGISLLDKKVLFYDGTYFQGTTVFSADTWYYIAVTYDGVTKRIYVNGKEENNGASSATGIAAGAARIGVHVTSGRYFPGSIDEPKIYNFALTAEQVKLDMNQGSAQVLGALSDKSTYEKQAANQEYCIPGDSTSCAAPVGRWDFEEGSGTSANDTSGNANTGTWAGTGTHWVNGKYGKTGKFNGTDDYVSLGNGSSLNLAGDLTIEMWLKPGSTQLQYTDILSKHATGASGYVIEQNSSNTNQYYFAWGNNGWTCNASTLFTLTANVWQYLSITKSGTTVTAYIDGKSAGTCTGSGSTIGTNSDNVMLSRFSSSGGRFWNGQIDQVRIFNYARSASQIAWDYNKGAPIGHWKLDECQGTTANDSSGTVNGSISIGASGTQTSAGTCQTSSTAWGNGATGKRNYSLNFDGTDDRVSFTVPAAFNLASGGGMAIAAWIKTSTDGRGILMLQTSNPLIYLQVGNTTNGGTANKFVAYIRDDSGAVQSIPINGVTTVTDNNWHHVAFVIDNTNLYLYVDGRRETSTTWAGGAVTIAGATGYLGDIFHPNFNWEFSGQIDDFRVYNYALSALQMKMLYNGGAVNYSPTTGAP